MIQQPTVTVTQQPVGARQQRSKYDTKTSIVLGSLQIAIGILSLIFNVGGMAVDATNSTAGHGIWCGIFFLITGIIGVLAGQRDTSSTIVAFMVLSIISAILCIFQLSFSANGITEDTARQCFYGFCYTVSSYDGKDDARVAMNGLLVFLALFEAIVAIWSSAICCASVCCGLHRNEGVVHSAHTVHYVNSSVQQPVMVISGAPPPQGQTVMHNMAPGQPVYPPTGYPMQQPPYGQPPPAGMVNPPSYSAAPPPSASAPGFGATAHAHPPPPATKQMY